MVSARPFLNCSLPNHLCTHRLTFLQSHIHTRLLCPMDALSTKQRPRNVFAAMLQSHRIRGLLFLVITLFGMYFFFLSTAQPHNSVPYMDDVNVNELQQGGSRSYIFVEGHEGGRTMCLISMGIDKLTLYFAFVWEYRSYQTPSTLRCRHRWRPGSRD